MVHLFSSIRLFYSVVLIRVIAEARLRDEYSAFVKLFRRVLHIQLYRIKCNIKPKQIYNTKHNLYCANSATTVIITKFGRHVRIDLGMVPT